MGERGKVTTATLKERKQRGERIAALTAYDHLFATILDRAGVDVILVGDSVATVMQGRDTTVPVTMEQMVYHCELVSRGCSRALVVGDLPFMSYQVSISDALRNAGRLLKEGLVEAVKLEGGRAFAPTVEKLVSAGIPVMGHVGLTPQSINQFGTYKTRGTEQEEQDQLIDDAVALEEAGAFAIVLEKVPAELGERMSAATSVPIIGIGAGPHTDGQILVTHDMLGMFTRFQPRFVRRYRELAGDIGEAIGDYCDDVRGGRFPSEDESY
ncbi:MAG: 3-methyl-2-oxobutanoate hydroxymethyltransferase [Planctomycetota bacterium]|nr:3-methyl-2-oxobutanoate hydroxymethyltransferase [Planctomycetota bacterium]MEC9047330.1 3-methyl-2-oxobutanoate hydroxymethyltransferase [Planctomycetota bacterium]